MTDVILTLNAGSSSVKFAIYADTNVKSPALVSGKVISLGDTPQFLATGVNGRPLAQSNTVKFNKTTSHEEVVLRLFDWFKHKSQAYNITGVGHRVVHGGRFYTKPNLITAHVISQLKTLIPLAPLHQPHNLSAVETVSKLAPKLPQVACFDTSYHHTQAFLERL